MPQKYAVPQFIDTEDKIMGPITVRQFVILLFAAMLMFITFKLADFTLFVILALFEIIVAGIIAFTKINGQPFHYFILNVVQTTRRPKIRVWDKELTTAELQIILKAPPPPPPRKKIIKTAVATTKLSELSMIVNTGGVYNPED